MKLSEFLKENFLLLFGFKARYIFINKIIIFKAERTFLKKANVKIIFNKKINSNFQMNLILVIYINPIIFNKKY